MNQKELIEELKRHSKVIKSIIALLQKIDDLEKDRNRNLVVIKKQIRKIKEIVADFVPFSTNNLNEWLIQFEVELRQTEERVQRKFGTELNQELQKYGITLTGKYPELRAGIFTIELDFNNWQATLWYGPKQEKLGKSPLTVTDLVKRINKAKEELGSHIPENELFNKLYQAYTRVTHKVGEEAPIIKLIGEMAYLIQNPRFYQDPRKEYYKSYGRADFSFDLFRLHRFQTRNPSSKKFHLIIATRAKTRRRSGFLWVPENEDGKGSVYSQLKFEEK